MSTVEQLLGYIEAHARLARAALHDEHEGMLRESVLQLQADADELAKLVTTW